jgi:hypothetical protein
MVEESYVVVFSLVLSFFKWVKVKGADGKAVMD